MRIGSLFSGIGGLELGLERAIPNARVVWQVERDPYARRVLAKHWPEARRYEDVREIGVHNLEPVDLICGGFPCQDISLAGSGAGIEGERSGLWFEFARIIGELRPRYAVLENVSAIRSRGLDRVLGSLAASGYDALWDCIPAAAVGAPHLRDRWFCIAWPASVRVPDAIGGGLRDQRKRGGEQYEKPGSHGSGDNGPDGAMADADGRRREREREPEHSGKQSARRDQFDGCSPRRWWKGALEDLQTWEAEPSVGRVADGVSNRIHRLRCLGNAVVPQVAEVVGRVVAELERLR